VDPVYFLGVAALERAIRDLRNWKDSETIRPHRLRDLVEFFQSGWFECICDAVGVDSDWLFETIVEAGLINQEMLSSGPAEWETPQGFFDKLDAEFTFCLDAAASDDNAKCKTYYTEKDNALDLPWRVPSGYAVWCNPPYGRKIGAFVAKGFTDAQRYGSTVVMLLPSRTDTKWWHDYVMNAAEIRFVRGRIKFVGGKSSAPFPSAVVVFRRGEWLTKMGAVKA